jgi:hypothetical protein
LNFSHCPSLVSIPMFPAVRLLDCSKCPRLTSIDVPPNIRILSCSYCPLLTTIRGLPEFLIFNWAGCPWLPRNPNYNANLEKLLFLQKAFKRMLFRQRINRFIILKKHLKLPRVLAGMIAGY